METHPLSFLETREPRLFDAYRTAERHWTGDPAAALASLQSFARQSIEVACREVQLPSPATLADGLEALSQKALLPPRIREQVEQLHAGSPQNPDSPAVIHALETAHAIAAWVFQTWLAKSGERPTPFRPPLDPAVEFETHRKAAEEGDPRAMYDLGCCFRDGFGTTADPALALQWLERAATLGDAKARYQLGETYSKGVLVDWDPARAVAYYESILREPGDASAELLELAADAARENVLAVRVVLLGEDAHLIPESDRQDWTTIHMFHDEEGRPIPDFAKRLAALLNERGAHDANAILHAARELNPDVLGTNEQARAREKRKYGKVGRNEPCPCGSGKKYKRCHGL